MNVAQETLGFRRAGLSPALSLLMSAFALPMPPACLSTHLHRPRERSSTTPSDSSTSLHHPQSDLTRATDRGTPDCPILWVRFASRCSRALRAPSMQNEVERT